jgi:hypothetical protein
VGGVQNLTFTSHVILEFLLCPFHHAISSTSVPHLPEDFSISLTHQHSSNLSFLLHLPPYPLLQLYFLQNIFPSDCFTSDN